MSWLYGSEQDRPWFRIGSYGVGTSDLVAGGAVVMMVVFAVTGGTVMVLALEPYAVLRHAYVWQVVTWPLVNAPTFVGLWDAVVLWFTGRQLERDLGKGRFGWLLVGITVGQSVLALLLSLAFRVDSPRLYTIGTIALIVILLFIAENPKARFFFGIPAWVIGVVLVAIPLLQYLTTRAWLLILLLLLSLVVSAIVAKYAGLLSQYAFVPGHRIERGARRPKPARTRSRRPRSSGETVVQGPWTPYEPPAREDAEMDALLDKIMATGLDSLTSKERKRLEELRQKRRAR